MRLGQTPRVTPKSRIRDIRVENQSAVRLAVNSATLTDYLEALGSRNAGSKRGFVVEWKRVTKQKKEAACLLQ